MKAAITELGETRRRLDVEIPAPEVDATIGRLAEQYRRRAKVPGFRPGKAPVHIVLQRFKDDILREAAHEIVPKAVDDALREQAVTPIETPDVQEVSIDDGQPLTFHALFEVMPSIEGLDYDALTVRRTPVAPDVDATDRALEELRLRASQLEPVTDRRVDAGDTVTLDLTRRGVSGPEDDETHPEDRHENVSIELGAAVNPPGLDAELTGLQVGESKAFELSYPADYEQTELAGTRVAYEVVAKAIHRRRLPDLDDEFAQSVGEFDTLEALPRHLHLRFGCRHRFLSAWRIPGPRMVAFDGGTSLAGDHALGDRGRPVDQHERRGQCHNDRVDLRGGGRAVRRACPARFGTAGRADVLEYEPPRTDRPTRRSGRRRDGPASGGRGSVPGRHRQKVSSPGCSGFSARFGAVAVDAGNGDRWARPAFSECVGRDLGELSE